MPKISPDPVASGPSIRAITAEGGFRIDDAVFASGALLTPEAAWDWEAPSIDALDIAAVAALFDRGGRPEFLLLGTGATLRRPPAAFVAALEARDIGLEIMDSRAAARAWGVLRAEAREIVAALFPLERA
jgi:uncharacterized protein